MKAYREMAKPAKGYEASALESAAAFPIFPENIEDYYFTPPWDMGYGGF